MYVSTNSPKVLIVNTTTNKIVKTILTTEERDAQAFEFDTLNNRLLYYKNTFSYWNNGQVVNIPYVFSAVKDYFIRKDGTNQKEIDIIKRKLAKDNIDNFNERKKALIKNIRLHLTLLKMDVEIKKSLRVDKTDVKRCCLIMDDLINLEINKQQLFT